MHLHKICWAMWILGIVLVVLAWVKVVNSTLGFVGLAIGLAGIALPYVVRSSSKQPPDEVGSRSDKS